LLSGKYHKNSDLLQSKRFFYRRRIQRYLESSTPLIAALEKIGKNHNATPAQVALNWLIHSNGETVVAIPGTKKAHQAEETAGAMEFELSKDEMEQLDELSQSFR
jgi:aryl-alcohol dehydrogenase-like predicted oxidoreductase